MRRALAAASLLWLAVPPVPAEAAALGPGSAATHAPVAQVGDPPPPPQSADTIRARVLERLRAQGRPGEGGAPPADSVAPLPEGVTGDSLAARLRAGVDTARTGARGQVRSPPAPVGADSLMRALLALPGYRASTFQGARADFRAGERVMTLQGTPEAPARFVGEGRTVEADSALVYDERRGRVRTVGPTLLTPDRGEPVLSSGLVYDLESERGSALGAQTTYQHGGRWIVSGDLPSVREGEAFGSRIRFTSCELDPPHTHFQAAQFKVIQDRVVVGRSVRMYIEDVPVMWLPFFAQNLGSGRASGLLTPTFSMNDVVRTSSGYNRKISNLGYYWAMSDYSDMTVALEWFSNNYTAVRGATRYRWRRQFLDGSLDFSRFWQASGSRQLTLSTRHNWVASERTRVRANARYASSSGFVRQNTFDPQELNQTIDSDAGLTHRFDWGQLAVGANRKQYLNEERTDMTLPSAQLSLSTLTLLGAPPSEARWYNNVSMSGAMSWTRDLQDRELQADSVFQFNRTSQLRTRGSGRGTIGLGRLSVSGNVALDERRWRDVPESLLPGFEEPGEPAPIPRTDLEEAQVTWSTSVSFQQRLIGSTTLTPSVSLDGRLMRVDSIPEARDYVSAPSRMRVGATLQTDLYGFYPGFGRFEAIRHKITPSLRWSYAPAVTADELQTRVFGARDAEVQNRFTFGFNQTWEARVEEEAPQDAGEGEGAGARPGDAPEDAREGEPERETPRTDGRERARILEERRGDQEEEVEEPEAEEPEEESRRDDGLRRLPQSRVMTLLALQTTAINYDVVRRDDTGRFIDGFTTTTLSNSVRSDFLQGISLSFAHDLFDDREVEEGGARRFSPHLSQLSLSFQLGPRSGLVRALTRLLGAEPGPGPAPGEEGPPDEPQPVGERPDGFDPNRIVPGSDRPEPPARSGQGWNARISYSLRRPRETGETVGSTLRAQMLRSQLSFQPSEHWQATWSTSYDLEAGRFNDHVVNLTRDLHEWEATFSFRQTATGNWAFQFEVSLRANRDLQVDFRQRSLEGGAPIGGALPLP